MSFRIIPGNRDDRTVVKKMVQGLDGWLFADKGYIGKKLAKTLLNQGIELIIKAQEKYETPVP